MKLLGLAALAVLAAACAAPAPPQAVRGVLDLRSWSWNQGPVALKGEWGFGSGFRTVPDVWAGSEAGGRDGKGEGNYRLRILLPEGPAQLAIRYATASTAMALREGGTELVRIGNPSPVASQARPGYAPGTVRVSSPSVLDLEIAVSNHEYRVGGLWSTPVLGPAETVERAQWGDTALALALATALTVIGLSVLLLFLYRRSEKTFLHLGIFSLLIALRSLVTGEYALVQIFPGIPFEILIRLEYLTAFLPLPSAVLFFNEFFPGMSPRWGTRLMTWPSWAFGLLTVALPLDLLTKAILGFYPAAVPALVLGTVLLVRRIRKEKETALLIVGVAVLAATGLADMATAAFLTTTGNLVPWGLGLFVVLQATTLAQRFLAAFERSEALLAEKDLLIKEVHHRVKNSLQVVASLVSLQANRIPDPAQKAVYAALRQRITAISLVHEKLYGLSTGGQPDLGQYLLDLLKLQYPRDGLTAGKVTWEVHADPLAAGVDYCVDAGLILTEMVGNAHKHGLSPRGGGRLEVSIRIRESRLAIEVMDDGPGFPPEFRPENGQGLGFRLILALAQRNEGLLTVSPGPGARVRVELNLPSAAG